MSEALKEALEELKKAEHFYQTRLSAKYSPTALQIAQNWFHLAAKAVLKAAGDAGLVKEQL